MYTWIWVFLLYSWKIETLFPKLEYQKLDYAAETQPGRILWSSMSLSKILSSKFIILAVNQTNSLSKSYIIDFENKIGGGWGNTMYCHWRFNKYVSIVR